MTTERRGRPVRPDTQVLHSSVRVDLTEEHVRDAVASRPLTPVRVGDSLRIAAFTGAGGGPTVTIATGSKFAMTRGSGALCTYWANDTVRAYHRTARGLVIERSSSARSSPLCRRLWDDGTDGSVPAMWAVPGGIDNRRTIIAQINAIVGPRPVLADRFPLLASPDSDGFAADLCRIPGLPAHVQDPWLDANDAKQVAQNLFGRAAYRKPLAREVTRHSPELLAFHALFRGLVDPERIIEALAALPAEHASPLVLAYNASTMRTVRRILVRTPEPVLRRILAAPTGSLWHALRDAAGETATRKELRIDLDRLPDLIAARGQRNIRTPGDLHDLVLALRMDEPLRFDITRRSLAVSRTFEKERRWRIDLDGLNQDRARQGLSAVDWKSWCSNPDLRERAEQDRVARGERAAAAVREQQELRRERTRLQEASAVAVADLIRARLAESGHNGLDGMRVEVASTGEQLREWGAAMGNCIGGYTGELDRSVLFAVRVQDTGTGADRIALNGYIRVSVGDKGSSSAVLEQLLGKHNRPAAECIDRSAVHTLLDLLDQCGVTVSPSCWGIETLQAA